MRNRLDFVSSICPGIFQGKKKEQLTNYDNFLWFWKTALYMYPLTSLKQNTSHKHKIQLENIL